MLMQTKPIEPALESGELTSQSAAQKIGARGREIYDRDIKPVVEAVEENIGKFAVIDVATGEYLVTDDRGETARAWHERTPGVRLYVEKIGYDVVASFRGAPRRTAPP